MSCIGWAGQIITVLIIPKRTNRMHMGADEFGDASSEKVPDDDASIVAPHSQQGALPVESTCHCYADTIQGSIEVLYVQYLTVSDLIILVNESRVRSTLPLRLIISSNWFIKLLLLFLILLPWTTIAIINIKLHDNSKQ